VVCGHWGSGAAASEPAVTDSNHHVSPIVRRFIEFQLSALNSQLSKTLAVTRFPLRTQNRELETSRDDAVSSPSTFVTLLPASCGC
jgi:hypothetical protein